MVVPGTRARMGERGDEPVVVVWWRLPEDARAVFAPFIPDDLDVLNLAAVRVGPDDVCTLLDWDDPDARAMRDAVRGLR
jgi:hypothetical protein